MTFKTTIYALCLLSICVILTTKNPVTNTFFTQNIHLIPDTKTIEDTAISVSLSFADFPKIEDVNQEFLCPISNPIVTSVFGSRTHPLTFEDDFHTGIDLATLDNPLVFSTLDGVVTDIGFDEIYGNYVRILHADGYESFYGHMSEIYATDDVLQGDVIGLIGDTGMATGEHLHFEISQNGELLDPSTVIDFYEN
ncbi:MAG: M23 family metallopeptidase [Clostridia bacterium]